MLKSHSNLMKKRALFRAQDRLHKEVAASYLDWASYSYSKDLGCRVACSFCLWSLSTKPKESRNWKSWFVSHRPQLQGLDEAALSLSIMGHPGIPMACARVDRNLNSSLLSNPALLRGRATYWSSSFWVFSWRDQQPRSAGIGGCGGGGNAAGGCNGRSNGRSSSGSSSSSSCSSGSGSCKTTPAMHMLMNYFFWCSNQGSFRRPLEFRSVSWTSFPHV